MTDPQGICPVSLFCCLGRQQGEEVISTLLVVISDIHANSTVAVCPPSINLDDGGSYKASKAQLWIWDKWLKFWSKVKEESKGYDKLCVVLNGDLVDGDHHDTPQIITRNMETQSRIALAVIKPMLDLNPDAIYVIRGTESHVGKSGQWEEFIANDIGAVVDEQRGTSSWWHLKLRLKAIQRKRLLKRWDIQLRNFLY